MVSYIEFYMSMRDNAQFNFSEEAYSKTYQLQSKDLST